jgi:hypothetical protein
MTLADSFLHGRNSDTFTETTQKNTSLGAPNLQELAMSLVEGSNEAVFGFFLDLDSRCLIEYYVSRLWTGSLSSKALPSSTKATERDRGAEGDWKNKNLPDSTVKTNFCLK